VGIDILDICFRLERVFGVKITHKDLLKLSELNADRDVLVGDLFDLVQRTAFQNGLLDEEIDGEENLWPLFQQVIMTATGVNADEVQRDRGLVRDLGIC
jgi:hypothetical protein